ncbi:MAG: GAF domain-containing sensor histidine kinase [Planctomycetota bacterium]|jgi:signal transduction histidine kinase
MSQTETAEFFEAELAEQVIYTPEEQIVLNTINSQVAGEESLGDILDFLFMSTRELCPCDRLALALVEEETERIISDEVRATYVHVILKAGYTEDLAGSSLQHVINDNQIRLINDLEAYKQANPHSRSTSLILREGIRSSLTCPLKVSGRNVGVLFRSSVKPNAFAAHDVGMHLAITERVSRAVERAYTTAKATKAYNSYMEMLSFVTHELKSPVSSIIMDADMLRQGYLGDLSDKQTERIERMMSRGRYLLNLVGEYLNLARMETGELKINARDGVDALGQLAENAIDLITPQLTQREMTLERDFSMPEGVTVECDPDLLQIVLVNFLSNAVKYGRKGGDIRFTMKLDGGTWHMSVWNEGPGFSKEERFKLFHKFSRLDDPELKRQKGTGVGLYTVWRVVQLHGGRVTANSKHGEWAEFTVEIPQPLPEVGAVQEAPAADPATA